jgi:hypothetical protein
MERYDHSIIGPSRVPEYLPVAKYDHSLIGPDNPVGKYGLHLYLRIRLWRGMIIVS